MTTTEDRTEIGPPLFPDGPPATIHERMAAILRDLPAIPKGETAPANMGGYKFRGIADILSALKPTMGKHGVYVLPAVAERRDSERSVGQGKTMFVVDVRMHFRFVAEGSDFVDVEMWGCGTDMGDKAFQKAVTSAFKSALGVTFCIADEATDSERHSVPETERHRETDWFVENGWRDAAQHDDWRGVTAVRVRAATPEVREKFNLWKREQEIDLTRPVTREQAALIQEWLEDNDVKEPDPNGTPTTSRVASPAGGTAGSEAAGPRRTADGADGLASTAQRGIGGQERAGASPATPSSEQPPIECPHDYGEEDDTICHLCGEEAPF